MIPMHQSTNVSGNRIVEPIAFESVARPSWRRSTWRARAVQEWN
jgi:hypothetical protein